MGKQFTSYVKCDLWNESMRAEMSVNNDTFELFLLQILFFFFLFESFSLVNCPSMRENIGLNTPLSLSYNDF